LRETGQIHDGSAFRQSKIFRPHQRPDKINQQQPGNRGADHQIKHSDMLANLGVSSHQQNQDGANPGGNRIGHNQASHKPGPPIRPARHKETMRFSALRQSIGMGSLRRRLLAARQGAR
jgi:hypothetical protein